jgi:hypothetical protein
MWLVSAGCFGFVFWRVRRAASAVERDVFSYLSESFDSVPWLPWLTLMVGYCTVYVVLDSVVVARVVSWSLTPARVRDILPLRAASSVLSLVSEPVGKGAVALGVHRRYGTPVGAAASSLAFVMVAEFLSLGSWAVGGLAAEHERLPEALAAIPVVFGAGLLVIALTHLGLRHTDAGHRLAARRPLLQAFSRATAWRYAEVIALRAPAMALAVGVYTLSLQWFGVEVPLARMAGVLPVVLLAAAVPGPLRAVAVASWVALFPDDPGRMAAFGLLQHLAFLVINAAIGLAFLPAALRSLGDGRPTPPAAPSKPRW